jgi:hypothetical protein
LGGHVVGAAAGWRHSAGLQAGAAEVS